VSAEGVDLLRPVLRQRLGGQLHRAAGVRL
jgi:hypothetical protein